MHNDPPSPILHKPWHTSPQLGVVDAVVVVVDGSVGVDGTPVVGSVTSVVIFGVCSVFGSVVDLVPSVLAGAVTSVADSDFGGMCFDVV